MVKGQRIDKKKRANITKDDASKQAPRENQTLVAP
jgi:hypothetical protein